MSGLLRGKTILVTGWAKRVGKMFTPVCARAVADVVIHFGHSAQEAEATREEITRPGRRAWIVPADLKRGDLRVPLIGGKLLGRLAKRSAG